MKFFRLLLIVLPVIVSKADDFPPTAAIPTYSYFYTCDSGVVNCGDFGPHNYGDFGMIGDINPDQVGALSGPIGPNEFDMFFPTESNDLGQVLGLLSTPLEGRYLVLGFDGFFSIAAPAFDAPGGLFPSAIDINNNGLYLASDGNPNDDVSETLLNGSELSDFVNGGAIAQELGLNGECTDLETTFTPGCPSSFWIYSAQGINDSNQILATIEVFDSLDNASFIQGVFSPTPVPEPSALIMLGTVGLLFTMRYRSRYFKKAAPIG